MHADELLDLVNDKDEVIGTILRSEYDRLATDGSGYVRAVEMFIQNDEGKFWIPKRTAHKKIAPNGLDYSMGGHVGAGEEYMESALREIQEELGLNLRPEDLTFVAKFPPAKTFFFRTLYIYHSNEAPNYNPDDYVSAEWLSLEELAAKLDSGVPAKLSLKETVIALQRDGNASGDTA